MANIEKLTPIEVDILLSERIDNTEQRVTELESGSESLSDRVYAIEEALPDLAHKGFNHVLDQNILSSFTSPQSVTLNFRITAGRLYTYQLSIQDSDENEIVFTGVIVGTNTSNIRIYEAYYSAGDSEVVFVGIQGTAGVGEAMTLVGSTTVGYITNAQLVIKELKASI